MEQLKKVKNNNREEILYGVIFLMVNIVLVFKCCFAGNISLYDETFYIATAQRFLNGDILLVNDWHPAQMASVPLIPFLYIWRVINGNNSDGMLLYFRLIYLAIKGLVVLYTLHVTKKCKYHGLAFVASLLLYCSSPLCVDVLSYNTMGFIAIFVLILNIIIDKKTVGNYILEGLLFTLIVFIQPYNLFLYITYVGIVIVIEIIRKMLRKKGKEIEVSSFFSLRGLLIVSVTAGMIAIIFCIYLLFSADIKDIIINIQYILNEPDHVKTESFITILKQGIVHDIDTFLKSYPIVTIINLLWIVVLIIGRKLKKNLSIPTLFILILSLIYVAVVEKGYPMNYMYMAFIWFSFEVIILAKKVPVTLYALLAMTFVYTFGYAMGSNMNILSSSAEMVAIAFIDIMMWEYVDCESKSIENIHYALFGVVIIIALVVHFMWISSEKFNPSQYNLKLEKGPLKGLYVTENLADTYNGVINDMDFLHVTHEDILMCGETMPYAYLYTNAKVGIQELFFFSFHSDRLMNYYELNPDKIPTVMYSIDTGDGDIKADKNYLNFIDKYQIIKREDKEIGRRR